MVNTFSNSSLVLLCKVVIEENLWKGTKKWFGWMEMKMNLLIGMIWKKRCKKVSRFSYRILVDVCYFSHIKLKINHVQAMNFLLIFENYSLVLTIMKSYDVVFNTS